MNQTAQRKVPPDRQTVRLTLEHAGGSGTAAGGLKRLLKVLKRAYGWRCVAIEEVIPAAAAQTTVGDGRGEQAAAAQLSGER